MTPPEESLQVASVTASSPVTNHEVSLEPPPPTKPISASEKLGLKPRGEIQGPKEALGKSATPDRVVRDQLKTLRERHAPKIVVPRADVKPQDKPAGKLAERERDEKGRVLPKKVEGVVDDTKKPVETPVLEKKPEPPAKIKIGDEELTPEEIADRLKAAKEPKKEEIKPDTTEADEKARGEALAKKREAFLTSKLTAIFTPEQKKKMDQQLIDGKYEEFFRPILDLILDRYEDSISQADRAISNVESRIKPLDEHYQTIQTFRKENEFLDKFPDIKADQKAVAEARAVRTAMSGYYDQIQQKIAQGTATAEEKQTAERFEKATAEEYDESVAAHTRQRLGLTGKEPEPPPVDKKPVATPPASIAPTPKPQPKPPTGQPPGGVASPTAMNEQQLQVAKMRAFRNG